MAAMAERGNHGEMRKMWPSREVADLIFSTSNIVLIGGGAITVIATIGVVWMANIREEYLNIDLSKANERIASAQDIAAQANKRAAELEKEAANARLETERLKSVVAWRSIPESVASRLLKLLASNLTAS